MARDAANSRDSPAEPRTEALPPAPIITDTARMNYYVLFYEAGPDMVERRAPYRAEHLALAQAAADAGELILGGAFDQPADASMLVFRGPNPEVAERFAAADPYVRHGVISQWRVRPWTVVIGQAYTPAST